MPAKSLYSYSDTLYSILDSFRPRSVFEWGPGTSTQIMALHGCVEELTSVEHEKAFFDVVDRMRLPNVRLLHRPDMDGYVGAITESSYDLVFVDGRDRSRCLSLAKVYTKLVLLHDAARSDYREAVDSYRFQMWTDEGNTVALTDDAETYTRLMECLRSLECDKPEAEVVRMVGHSLVKGEVF